MNITFIHFTDANENDKVVVCVNGNPVGTCADNEGAIALFKEQMSK